VIWQLTVMLAFAQQPDPGPLLDHAFRMLKQKNYSIKFEAIVYGAQAPLDIFKLPAYKVLKGGYFFVNDKKYEFKLGKLQGVCDGKISVVVYLDEQIMYVDSVRSDNIIEAESAQQNIEIDLSKIIDIDLKNQQMKYLGKESVNGKSCHKIKVSISDQMYTIYYIHDKTGELLLFADFQNGLYDVFQINKITTVPANYNYTVKMPKEKLTTFHGFRVFDYRYLRAQVYGKK
jgi:hypothetical protein